MAGRFEGRVVVITGGASGMGRSTALRFLKEGASVVIGDLNEDAAAETAALAEKAGHRARLAQLRMNVAEETDVEKLVALAVSTFGRIDCIFNNAGIGGAFGSVMDIDVRDWDYTFAVMVRGVFLGIKHASRAMVKLNIEGSIINTASVAGFTGGDAPMAYSSAKAAVISITRAAAVELARYRIRVNCICPGVILTPILHRGSPEKVAPLLSNLQPWPEPGMGDHIAGAALFLASDDARFVTGEELVVDGGLRASGHRLGERIGQERNETKSPISTGLDLGTTGLDRILRKPSP